MVGETKIVGNFIMLDTYKAFTNENCANNPPGKLTTGAIIIADLPYVCMIQERLTAIIIIIVNRKKFGWCSDNMMDGA